MNALRRIAEGGLIDRKRSVGFRFNGKSYRGTISHDHDHEGHDH